NPGNKRLAALLVNVSMSAARRRSDAPSLRLLAEEAALDGRNHAARQPLAEPSDEGQCHELEIGLRSIRKMEWQYLGLQNGKDEQGEGDPDHRPHRPQHPKQSPVGPGVNGK